MTLSRPLASLVCVLATIGPSCMRAGLDPWSKPDAGPDADVDVDSDADSDADPDGDTDVDDEGTFSDGNPGDADDDCPEEPCRLLAPQCGCVDGKACVVVSGARTCVLAGTSTSGDACTEDSDCVPGLICNLVDSDSIGVCSPLCGADTDCGADEACIRLESAAFAGIGVCSRSCEPLAQTGCPVGLACDVASFPRLDTGGSVVVTFCRATGEVQLSVDCSTDRCLPGLSCVMAGELGLACVELCERGVTVCSGGETCINIWSGSPWGICTITP